MFRSEALELGAEFVSALEARLACPVCASGQASISLSGDAPACCRCQTRFPAFRCGQISIPWLFADSENTRLEWKARYNGFLHANSAELARLRSARNVRGNGEASRRRISQLVHAQERYRNQVSGLLEPLCLDGINWPADTTNLLQSKLPGNQGLSSYSANIFRDWAWNNGEGDALADAVASVLDADARDSLGAVLTLGAGACRLPYDLHRRYSPGLSVMLDLNPLLLQIAGRVIQGETVSLYEFPVAPLNEASFAVEQECRAPVPLKDGNVHFLLGDALNPPFADSSFDTVITPWLIDIVPQNLREFIPRINRLLVPDGVWINTGSLAFFHKDESWCFSEEELLELIEDNGFEILAAERRSVHYLQSPHSAHGRTEKILSFSARKSRDAEAPVAHAYLPDWILDTSRPVPSSTESSVSSSHHLLMAQVLASIDGKRTIRQIGRMVARQYGLGVRETIHAVTRILVDAWEEGNTARSDRL